MSDQSQQLAPRGEEHVLQPSAFSAPMPMPGRQRRPRLVLDEVFAFNRLVRRRNRVDAGWAQIDTELQRRHDLVPTIVSTVRGAADYERGVLDRTTAARAAAVAAGSIGERARAESALTRALRSLFMVEEAYPELTANANFRSLQAELAHTEERIAYARAYYNAAVAEYETSRSQFPSRLIAGAFGFEPRAFFEIEIGARPPISVDLSFGEEA